MKLNKTLASLVLSATMAGCSITDSNIVPNKNDIVNKDVSEIVYVDNLYNTYKKGINIYKKDGSMIRFWYNSSESPNDIKFKIINCSDRSLDGTYSSKDNLDTALRTSMYTTFNRYIYMKDSAEDARVKRLTELLK